jgi:uncharacterized protein (DUF1778 family)
VPEVEKRTVGSPVRRPRLSIEIEPQLRRRLRIAAAQRDVSIREFVLAAVEQALKANESLEAKDWSALSVPSFARDWNSDADSAYDPL